MFKSRLLKLSSGYSRLMRILHGTIPTVTSFAILSVDNPRNLPLSPVENREREKRFKEILRREQLGYVMHGGMYNRFEHAFFVMNVSYGRVAHWCGPTMFDQESFIYGEVHKGLKEVVFKFIENGRVVSERKVSLYVENNVDNFYSVYKGRKFLIPFFDDDHELPGDWIADYPNDNDANSNIPKDTPFVEEELLEGDEDAVRINKAQIASIKSKAESLELDALGLRSGMSLIGTRGGTLNALRRLVV